MFGIENFQKKRVLKEAQRLYKEVLKSFPSVREEDIELLFNRYIPVAGYSTLYPQLQNGRIVYIKRPIIDIGYGFLNGLENEEERKSTLAHEIGHHMDEREKSDERIKTRGELNIKMNKLRIGAISYMGKRKIERLEDYCQRVEMAADNHVAKTEHAKGLINLYRKYPTELSPKLVKNLEQNVLAENGIPKEVPI